MKFFKNRIPKRLEVVKVFLGPSGIELLLDSNDKVHFCHTDEIGIVLDELNNLVPNEIKKWRSNAEFRRG